MSKYEDARTRRLEQALNYVSGYLTALEAYANTQEQRESAAMVHNAIIANMAPMPCDGRDAPANE